MNLLFKTRLARLEKNASEGLPEALKKVVGIKYYDELTDAEKTLWTKYRWSADVDTFETIERTLASIHGETLDWHFICDRKPKPPTAEQLREIRVEIEQYIQEKYERGI